jgi:hypothetical protein
VEATVPVALSMLAIGGAAMLAAGAVWCFVFPAVQNQIGLEAGKWKATGLPTGAILIVAGVGLLYLDSENKPPPKPEITEVALATAEGQPSVDAYLRCPFTVNLKGRISVTSGEGDIAYRFVRQPFNGPEETTEIQRISADGPGSYSARDSYTFNVPVGQLYVEDRLEVMTPENLSSEPVKMNVRCDANLPPGPPTPPPDVPSPQQR